jgi:hypothetical protein
MYQQLGDLILPEYLSFAQHIGQMVDVAGVLPNYPLIDQLHEPTSDGLADENARMNCVFASDAGIVKYLCKPNHQDVNGDYIKDHTPGYGQGYLGGSAQERIAPYLKETFGVDTLVQKNEDRSVLLGYVLANLDQGYPTMITMPSAWNSQKDKPGFDPNHPDFPTHAGTAFGYNPSTRELLVANPWGGFLHRGTYAYWTAVFCYMKVYRQTLIGAGKMPLPTGWKDSGEELTNDQNGFKCIKGVRNLVLDAPYWPGWDVPIEDEHEMPEGVPLELSNPAYGQDDDIRVQQRFRGTWVAARRDRATQVWHIGYEWVGVEADFLRKEVDKLNAEIAALKSAPPPPPPPPAEITTRQAIDKIEGDLKDAGKLE